MLKVIAQIILFLLIFLRASVGFTGTVIPTYSTALGFYSPIFDPDARVVTYIQREVTAWDWGPGWESFSPPAFVRISRDTFRLRQYDLLTETITTLRTFPESPLAGLTHRHYRNRLYGLPRVMLRYERETGQLEYEIAVRILSQPSSTSYRIYRWWNNRTKQIEQPKNWLLDSDRMQGLNEDRLRGDVELLALPGPEGMPCAIVSWDHRTNFPKVLVKSSAFEKQYPEGIPLQVLAELSEKKQIERLRTVRSEHERFYQEHLAQGLGDGAARLAAIEDMQEVGYFPKDPTLTARVVEPGEQESALPVFAISQTEMESGIFNDIAAAVQRPGTTVKNNGYGYIIYSGYETSRMLNDYLKTGALAYRVLYQGRLYELQIRKY